MSLDFVVGDTVGTSAVVTVSDLSEYYLEIFLDETDWGSVAVGYDAEVIFDALPDDVFNGEVTQVDPGLYESGNTSVVRGLVLLDETPESLNLPIGTGAAVDIIGGRARWQRELLLSIDRTVVLFLVQLVQRQDQGARPSFDRPKDRRRAPKLRQLARIGIEAAGASQR